MGRCERGSGRGTRCAALRRGQGSARLGSAPAPRLPQLRARAAPPSVDETKGKLWRAAARPGPAPAPAVPSLGQAPRPRGSLARPPAAAWRSFAAGLPSQSFFLFLIEANALFEQAGCEELGAA